MKYGDIVLIDDVVGPDHEYGKMLAEIVEPQGYTLTFINRKEDLDNFISADLQSVRLILLDLDLEEMGTQVISENVLDWIVRRKLKVIILSVLPRTKTKRKQEFGEKYGDLPDANRLYSKGILTYIAKQELREKPDTVANIIDRSIRDPYNQHLKLVLNCESANLNIVDEETKQLAQKDMSGVHRDWRSAIQPKKENEIILRLLLEMGRTGKMEAKLSNIYPPETQILRSRDILKEELDDLSDALEVSEERPGCRDAIRKIMNAADVMRRKLSKKSRVTKKDVEDMIRVVSETTRPEKMVDRSWDAINDFLRIHSKLEYTGMLGDDLTKALDEFNKDLRVKSKGIVVGRLLQGPGKGDRSGVYRANIGRIELVNDVAFQLPSNESGDRLPSTEKRILSLEAEIRSLQNDISSMRSRMEKLEAFLSAKSG
jgi:hypothetical protein